MKAVQAITRSYVIELDEPDKVEALCAANATTVQELLSAISYAADGGDFEGDIQLVRHVDGTQSWVDPYFVNDDEAVLGEVSWKCGAPSELMVEE